MRFSFGMLFAFFLVAVLAASGCTSPGDVSNQSASQQANQTNYNESADGNVSDTTVSFFRINLSSNGLVVDVFPTDSGVVEGNITVSISSLPEDTQTVWITLVPQAQPDTETQFDNNNTIVAVFNATEAQSAIIDTSSVMDGTYDFGVMAALENPPDGNPWLAIVQTEIVVNNSANITSVI